MKAEAQSIVELHQLPVWYGSAVWFVGITPFSEDSLVEEPHMQKCLTLALTILITEAWLEMAHLVSQKRTKIKIGYNLRVLGALSFALTLCTDGFGIRLDSDVERCFVVNS